MNQFTTTLLAAAVALTCGAAQAATLRVADVGDVQSMDPHSLNETLQLSFTGNIYEPWWPAARTCSWCRRWPRSGSRRRRRCGVSNCVVASNSTTARRSRPTTWCSLSNAPPPTAPT